MAKLIVFLITMTFFGTASQAARQFPIAILDGSKSQHELFQYSFLIEDRTHSWSVHDLVRLPPDLWLASSELGRSSWGFSKSRIWLKLHVKNQSAHEVWYLGSHRPDQSIVHMALFRLNGELLAEQISGANIPISERPEEVRLPLAAFQLPADEELIFLVGMESPLYLTLPIFAHTPRDFRRVIDRANYTYAIYYGVILSLIVYNFILFLLLRYKDYIYYCLFGSSMLLNTMAQGGMLEILPFRFIVNSIHDTYYLICLPPITAMLYTKHFLKLSTIAPRFDRLMTICIIIFSVVAILIASPWRAIFLPLNAPMNFICLIFIFIGSVLASMRRDPAAYTFAFAWGIFAVLVAIWTMGNQGLLEKTYFVAFSAMFGNMIELILMSIALAIRIKLLEKQKQVAEIKAEESEQLKKLLRVVCHDINNPLSVILGTIWLARNRNPKDPNILFDRISRASSSIEQIIDHVRQYESVRAGKVRLKLKPMPLSKVFDNCKFFFQSKAEEKRIRLDFQIDSVDGELWIVADEVSFSHEIMGNLISNAIKFSPQTSTIRIKAAIGKNKMIIIEVSDQGIGIPESILAQIFNPNAITSRLGTASEKGTGFGMPIVKSYVEKIGGLIEVSSKEMKPGVTDHGTSIRVFVPMAKAATNSSSV